MLVQSVYHSWQMKDHHHGIAKGFYLFFIFYLFFENKVDLL